MFSDAVVVLCFSFLCSFASFVFSHFLYGYFAFSRLFIFSVVLYHMCVRKSFRQPEPLFLLVANFGSSSCTHYCQKHQANQHHQYLHWPVSEFCSRSPGVQPSLTTAFLDADDEGKFKPSANICLGKNWLPMTTSTTTTTARQSDESFLARAHFASTVRLFVWSAEVELEAAALMKEMKNCAVINNRSQSELTCIFGFRTRIGVCKELERMEGKLLLGSTFLPWMNVECSQTHTHSQSVQSNWRLVTVCVYWKCIDVPSIALFCPAHPFNQKATACVCICFCYSCFSALSHKRSPDDPRF